MTESVQGSGRGGERPSAEGTSPMPDDVGAAFARLETAITGVLALDVDALSQPQAEAALRRLQPQLDRVQGYRSRLAGVLAEHARSRLDDRATGHAEERARRDAARFLRSELHLTDSEAKRAITAGQQARTSPSVSRATRDGRLNPEQSATIARLLEDVDAAVRDRLEVELIDAAGRMDAVALGRFGRRRLLELDPAQGERRERRDHRRRAFRLTQSSDGAVIPSGRLYGAQAEVAMAAWHAFRRPDARGEVRTPDQRGADAFEQLCAVALRAGEAPTRHGERPQLLIVTEQQTLLDAAGVVDLGFTGPASLATVRCLLSDCTVSRIGLGEQEVDVSVSKKVRTVPAGLWRVLVSRDRGCTWSGCDAPAAWCDVAHGEQSYAADGHLSPSNAALLCRRHHRTYDHGPYVMVLDGNAVRYERQPDVEVAPNGRAVQLPTRHPAAGVEPDPATQLSLTEPPPTDVPPSSGGSVDGPVPVAPLGVARVVTVAVSTTLPAPGPAARQSRRRPCASPTARSLPSSSGAASIRPVGARGPTRSGATRRRALNVATRGGAANGAAQDPRLRAPRRRG